MRHEGREDHLLAEQAPRGARTLRCPQRVVEPGFLFGAQQAAGRTTLKPADRALISADPAKTGVEGPHGHLLY